MNKYEIVFTSSFLDVGLCTEYKATGGKPAAVMARSSHYNGSPSYYGGVEMLDWVRSGVFVMKTDWLLRTNQQMSPEDVACEFGIDIEMLRNSERQRTKNNKRCESDKLRDEYTDMLFNSLQEALINKCLEMHHNKTQTLELLEYQGGYIDGVEHAIEAMRDIVIEYRKNKT